MHEFRDTQRPVTIVLAVFRPDQSQLTAQIKSLRAQHHPISNLVVVIADLLSAGMVREDTHGAGWTVDIVIPDVETSSFKSFELGLQRAIEVSPETALIGLCDQDDIWHVNKIAESVQRLEASDVSLVHSDARVVDADGKEIDASLFKMEKRVVSSDPRALLLRNCVTGMTTLSTRETAAASLPFPSQSALFFHHDLWLALVASVLRGISFINTPLVDYRQHSGNVVGAVTARHRPPRVFSKAWAVHWTGTYSVATYLAKSLYLRVQEITEAGTGAADGSKVGRLSPYLTRRGLGGRFVSDGAAWLARGRATFACQSAMFGVVQMARMAWAVDKCLRSGTLASLATFDAKAFAIAPGAQPGHVETAGSREPEIWRASSFQDRRTARRFDIKVDPFLGGRILILIPSLNPSEVFAGIATAIDIGLGLARHGHRIVFVATDLPIASHERSHAFIRARFGAGGNSQCPDFEMFCGVTNDMLVLSAHDRLIATAWWSAHVADSVIRDADLDNPQFYYLVQDFEPGFYPWGGEYTGALASYDLDFVPIFNTSLLRDYFRGLGHVAPGLVDFTFQPSIDIARYAALTRAEKKVRRMVIYGRPEVSRNLFPLAVEGLDRFLNSASIAPHEIEVLSVGLKHPDVSLNNGHRLRSLGKIPWDDYPDFLSSVDVGLSLMVSPHPSHPPLEMAAAGARVVTNSFANKDLGALGPQILSVSPTAKNIARALTRAWTAPAPSADDRHIDLSALGRPLGDVVADLSVHLSQTPIPIAKAG